MEIKNFKSRIIDFLKKDLSQSFRFKKKAKKRNLYSQGESQGPKKTLVALLILAIFVFGFFGGSSFGESLFKKTKDFILEVRPFFPFLPEAPSPSQPQSQPQFQPLQYLPQTSQEEAVIKVVKEVSPAVVSIIITKDLPVFEKYYENPFPKIPGFPDFPEFEIPRYRQKGVQKQKIGGGTGFIISEEGMVLTNKHVVLDEEANYTILTNEGQKYQAKVLARDPFQDLAILKIEKDKVISEQGEFFQKPFSSVHLGESSNLEIGQTVIAIGNALGEFRNTVSVGVISGLGRTITASGGGLVETLEDVIQTDAAINKGNSGGPLLNLKGEVIGVNVAMAEAAQSIGFAIPINKAKRDISQIKTLGKIIYPFLGVRYILLTPEIQEEKNLAVDYGALIIGGETAEEPAIIPGSQAEKAGLREGDIILKFQGEKITVQNSLAKIIQSHNPGDKITLEILRGEKEIKIEAVLGEKSS